MAKKVSVIIPNLNRASFLREALQSVMMQTAPVLEIIVADMMSRDNSSKVATSFGPKIKFISKPFKNQSESRNFGIKLAKGDLVAFLDSDDLWLEKKVEEQVNFMKKNRNCAFSYTDAVVIDTAWKDIPRSYVYHYQKKNTYVGKIARKLFLEHNVIPTSSVMAWKNDLNKVDGFDENLSYHEDRDLWIRLAMEGEVGFLDKILAVYRVHQQQFTHSFFSPQKKKFKEEQWQIVQEKYRGRL